jgi:signal transduction histidine kinase
VNPVEGASLNPEGTNSHGTVVVPPPSFRDLTNGLPRDHEPHPPGDMDSTNPPSMPTNLTGTNFTGENGPPPPPPDERPRNNNNRGRPPWMRWMSDADYKAFIAGHELHGLVLVMSTQNAREVAGHDLVVRLVIAFFAGVAALGASLAWRNFSKNSDLQLRLVRASELNSHLREMNLAAAGLAHETRNPLNIIRGMAQMLSRQSDAPPEIREKSRVILEETDKVTAQLTEFINYSRPREVRRVRVQLNAAVSEVLRTLNGDIEENKIRMETLGDPMAIEADEQMLRQVLFNLLINAIQAVGPGGKIQVQFRRASAAEAMLEIRDNGPGVPPERRQEIFKPYFTTHQKGTGLGLAVVQQMVLAHGWEIQCLPNEPKGAVFRISHLKFAA